MIDANTFVKEFGNQPTGISVQFASVDVAYSTGNPKLLFDGETALSTKTYPFLTSYSPTAGQRVMVLNGVILGGF